MTAEFLSDQQMAEYFLQAGNTVQPDASPVDLEPRIEAWLSRANMSHRNAFRIAIEVTRLARPVPIPAPRPVAFAQDVVNGISDPPADEAARIRDMPLAEWEKERSKYIRRRSGEGVGIFGALGR